MLRGKEVVRDRKESRTASRFPARWTLEPFTEMGAVMSSAVNKENLQVPKVGTSRYPMGHCYVGLKVGQEDQAEHGGMEH